MIAIQDNLIPLSRLSGMNPWEYLIDGHHNLAWCNVFKAASSSWMWIFNILAGYEEDYLNDPNNKHVGCILMAIVVDWYFFYGLRCVKSNVTLYRADLI